VSEGKKYGEIAEELGCTSCHVTDTAAKLWQAISQALGEKVTKKNFKSSIGRYQSSIVSSHRWKVGSINFCPNDQGTPPQNPEIQQPKDDRTPQKYLLDAPALLPFYGRTTELTQLQTYIENHSRLILIHAPSGTGKTALARQLIEPNTTPSSGKASNATDPSPNSSIATSPPTSARFSNHPSTSPSASTTS
jgi:hypothetical protein